MSNWCGKMRQIDTRLGWASYDSRIPSKSHILHAVRLHDVPTNNLRVQIMEIYTSRIIFLHGCSEQFLIETRQKRENPTNMCSSAEVLDIIAIDTTPGDFKRITFNVQLYCLHDCIGVRISRVEVLTCSRNFRQKRYALARKRSKIKD